MPHDPSEEPTEDDDSVTYIKVTETHEEILEYWTDERMAEAKPMELLRPDQGDAPPPDGQD